MGEILEVRAGMIVGPMFRSTNGQALPVGVEPAVGRIGFSMHPQNPIRHQLKRPAGTCAAVNKVSVQVSIFSGAYLTVV